MAQPHQPPDPYEQEYAIRELTAGMKLMNEQMKENVSDIRKLQEWKIEVMGKMAVWATLIATGVTIAIKFFFK